MPRLFPSLALASLGVAVLSFTLHARAQSMPGRNEVSGISKPSEERKLSFSGPGVVRESPLKEGDAVKQGDIVLAQEDVIDKKELERLELEAGSNARIEAAKADLGVKRAVLRRKTDANKANPDSPAYVEAEIEEAENDVILREKQLQVAEEEQKQAKIKAEQQSRKIELMQIRTPIDGIIEKVVVKVGEWADPQSREGAVVVVKNDPLYVEVRELTTRQVGMLEMGQKLKVRHADDPDKSESWYDAEIFYFAPVADAQANTRLVKLRVANPSGRASGQWMIVKLPEKVAEANLPQPANAANR